MKIALENRPRLRQGALFFLVLAALAGGLLWSQIDQINAVRAGCKANNDNFERDARDMRVEITAATAISEDPGQPTRTRVARAAEAGYKRQVSLPEKDRLAQRDCKALYPRPLGL